MEFLSSFLRADDSERFMRNNWSGKMDLDLCNNFSIKIISAEEEYLTRIRNEVKIWHHSENGHLTSILVHGIDIVSYIDAVSRKNKNLEKRYGKGYTPLFYATVLNDVEAVRYLVNAGANRSVFNDYGTSITTWASKNCDGEIISILSGGRQVTWPVGERRRIENNAKMFKTWWRMDTQYDAVMASKNDCPILAYKVLSESWYNIEYRFDGGYTFLHLAFIFSAKTVIGLLLQNGASVETVSNSGLSLVDYVYLYGSNDDVKLLEENKLAKRKNTFQSILKEMVSSNDEKKEPLAEPIAEPLMEPEAEEPLAEEPIEEPVAETFPDEHEGERNRLRANIISNVGNSRWSSNSTHLRFLGAVERDDVKTVCDIVSLRGIDNKFSLGYTALFYSAIFGATKSMKYLLNNGADQNTKNYDGVFLSDWVVEYGCQKIKAVWNGLSDDNNRQNKMKIRDEINSRMIFLLTTEGKSRQYRCIRAAENDNLFTAMEIMAEKGFKIDEKFDGGYTFLSFAVIYDAYIIAQTLIESGADKKIKNDDGLSPEYFAKGYPKMLNILSGKPPASCAPIRVEQDVEYVVPTPKSKNKKSSKKGGERICVPDAKELARKHEQDKIWNMVENLDNDSMQYRCVLVAMTNSAEGAIELMISPDFYMDEIFEGGYTFLFYAVVYDAVDVVEQLLANGANKNVSNDERVNLIDWCYKNGSKDMIAKFSRQKTYGRSSGIVGHRLNHSGTEAFSPWMELAKMSRAETQDMWEEPLEKPLLEPSKYDAMKPWEELKSEPPSWHLKDPSSYYTPESSNKPRSEPSGNSGPESWEKPKSEASNKPCSEPSGNSGPVTTYKRDEKFLEKVMENLWNLVTIKDPNGEKKFADLLIAMMSGEKYDVVYIIKDDKFDTYELYDGYNLLHLAMIFDNVEAAKYLIENKIGTWGGNTLSPENWARMYASQEINDLFNE